MSSHLKASGDAVSAEPPPSPAHVSSVVPGAWADATSVIAAACRDLQDGELVHGENFSLFAAMSALEIMDPKMDSGMERSGCSSIEEAIENGFAPIPLSSDKTIDVQRTIDVMDHLFSCEATWLTGHSLAQTVFTCIYLMNIERSSSHPLLHSYFRVLRATCNALISVVSTARTHEEEDVFTMSYGLPLKDDGDEKCLSLLNSVEETVARQLRACKAQISKKKPTEDIESLQTDPELEEGYCRALLCRLRFRKHYYHVINSLKRPQGRGLELGGKHVSLCLSELAQMRQSHEFLKSRQENAEVGTTASGCKPVGFEIGLNSKYLSPTPPRAVEIVSWNEAISYFEKLLNDLNVICTFPLDPSLENIMHFIVQFQKSSPSLVARAHLQVLLVRDGKLYGRDYFCDVISRALGFSTDLTQDKDFQTNEFVVQLCQLLINLIRILCTNLSWQRRKLGKFLQDWSNVSIQLQLALRKELSERRSVAPSEAQIACVKVSSQLLTWTQEQTLWVASRFLLLGFELELYSPNEYAMVYWYLYVVFMNAVEKVQLRTLAIADSNQRKGKKKKDHTKDSVRDAGFSPVSLLFQCYIFLSEGLAMMLAALANGGKTPKIPNKFNTEQERFLQHFDLLLKAQVPDNTTYMNFKESAASARIADVVKYNFFQEILKITASLKGSFAGEPERLQELRQIEQVAHYNRIALNIINQLGTDDSSLTISFEFTYHPHYAVAVVRRS